MIQQSCRGFTLVEVLLALAIASILFTAAFLGLNQIIQTRNELSNLATPYVSGPGILDVMAADLANVYSYDLKDLNSFYGTNAELNGKEADAFSFIAMTTTYAPEEFNGTEDLRDSHVNEISYVLRRGAADTPFLQLWRREDFFVDDTPHSGGDYVLLYDKVESMSVQYVSGNAQSGEGLSGPQEKDAEEMLQEEWNAVKEKSVPRAMLVTLRIFARDSEKEVDEAARDDEARVYTFQRYIILPQVSQSQASRDQVANWDGKFQEQAGASGNRNISAGQQGLQGGAGVPGQPPRTPGAGGARRRGQQAPGGANGANNPFMNALRNRGSAPAGGSPANISSIFGGLNR